MVLSVEEESLVKVLRALPPEETTKLLSWATHVAQLSKGKEIEWSDSWSEEDLADATAYSLRRFDEEHELR